MDQVTCKLEVPAVDGLDQVNVGRHQILNCEGEFPKTFDFSKAHFKLEENQKYTAKVLKAEARTPVSFDVDFTLYQAGTYQFQQITLTDGKEEIQLGPQRFQVVSVLEKTEDGKPPQPFGPILPLSLAWPAIYLILLISVIVLGVSYAFFQIRRRARLKRLIDGMKQYDSSFEPDLQFYKNMRAIEKLGYPIDEMEKAFRLYSLRHFQLPLFDLSNRQAMSFFAKRRGEFKKHRAVLQKFLDDFEELGKKPNLSNDERLQLAKRLYRFVDKQETKSGLNP